jgi:hypothetical protein
VALTVSFPTLEHKFNRRISCSQYTRNSRHRAVNVLVYQLKFVVDQHTSQCYFRFMDSKEATRACLRAIPEHEVVGTRRNGLWNLSIFLSIDDVTPRNKK